MTLCGHYGSTYLAKTYAVAPAVTGKDKVCAFALYFKVAAQ